MTETSPKQKDSKVFRHSEKPWFFLQWKKKQVVLQRYSCKSAVLDLSFSRIEILLKHFACFLFLFSNCICKSNCLSYWPHHSALKFFFQHKLCNKCCQKHRPADIINICQQTYKFFASSGLNLTHVHYSVDSKYLYSWVDLLLRIMQDRKRHLKILRQLDRL